MRTLVTGGIRSGKSAYAEKLLGHTPTHYVATGPERGDADWQHRIQLHADRRPGAWHTVETVDLARHLAEVPPETAVLIDDVGNWLSRTLDGLGAWGETDDPALKPGAHWECDFAAERDRFVSSVAAFAGRLVIVTSEVGFGLVSPYRAGRVFTDELGRLNQELAAACDEVVLVVSGCPLTVKGATP